MRKPTSVRELDPALALRDGRVDAWTVLVLWAIRKSWYALLLVGLTVSALLKGSPEDSGIVGWAEHHLVTPLVGLVTLLSALIRIGSKWVGMVAAYPLSRWMGTDYSPHRMRIVRWSRLVSARLALTRAYTALRWSRPVRMIAVERIGRPGRFFEVYSPVVLWTNIGLSIVYPIVAITTGTI
jgi:hypothetical protein